MRTFTSGRYSVEIDVGPQILRLAIPEDTSFGDADAAAEAELVPTPADLDTLKNTEVAFVSGSMLAQKAKLFDDGLYAAVELATQAGTGSFRGKAWLLRSLLPALSQMGSADGRSAVMQTLYGAAVLGGTDATVPSALRASVDASVEAFRNDALRSKPISFYTWTAELQRTFQQDRMLQQALVEKPDIESLVRALHAEPDRRAVYESYLELVSRLTNPFAGSDLREPLASLDAGPLELGEAIYHFIPPSVAHETALANRLYGHRKIPEGFDLVNEMIARVRDGRLHLEPTRQSGWYDFQTWALEPLVVPDRMPEAGHLELDDDYREQLKELFRGVLALTRETHIKQLEIAILGCGDSGEPEPKEVIEIRPQLSAEPLHAFFLRRALAYAFVRRLLERHFGEEGLREIRRHSPDGPRGPGLADEIRQVGALFHGAAVTVGREIGLAREAALTDELRRACALAGVDPDDPGSLGSGRGDAADAETFRAWARARTDADLSQDVRMMVPVFYDIDRQKTKVWAFLGWSARPVAIAFARPPEVRVTDARGHDARRSVEVQFLSRWESIAYPVTAEVYADEILNRDEFRNLCDQHRTRRAILEALR